MQSWWEKSGGRAALSGSVLSVCLWSPTPVTQCSMLQDSLWRWCSWHQLPSVRTVTLAHLLPALSQLRGRGHGLSGACMVLLRHLSRWRWCAVLPWEKHLSCVRSDDHPSNESLQFLEALLSPSANSDFVITMGDSSVWQERAVRGAQKNPNIKGRM